MASTKSLMNAIEIIELSLKKSISLTKAANELDLSEKLPRHVRQNYPDKSDPDYVRFINLYSKALDGPVLKEQENKPVLNKKVKMNEMLEKAMSAAKQTISEKVNLIIDEQVADIYKDFDKVANEVVEDEKITVTEDQKTRTKEIDCRGNSHIKTLEDLIQHCKIDRTLWNVDRHIVNKWDTTYVDNNGEAQISQNYQVKAFLSKKKTEEEENLWETFLKTIESHSPDYSFLNSLEKKKGNYLLELSIPDLHIGKLAHEDETGENYDTKIAIQRYKTAIDHLLSHVRNYSEEINEILLPIGNDLFNVDNMVSTTTAGTRQDCDSRWQKMFLKAKELLISTIDKLALIAPVRIVMVSGNHDYQTVYYLGDTLTSWYRNTDRIKIDNSMSQRKYHVFGINLIGYTHGNEEKHADLGLIMATERPELWAKTKCRQIHLGHYHSRRRTKYNDVGEYQGFIVRILPSLSSSDQWHSSKGYMSMKSATAFLYDKENGLVGEFSHNVIR